MELTLEQIARYTNGQVYGEPGVTVQGVQIDSRKVQEGALFVALKGEKADGHAFVLSALAQGRAALVNRRWAEANAQQLPKDKGLVAVEDPLAALQTLAHNYRRRFKIPVVGVTGSSGKTTTKDMIAAVVGEGFPVHKTMANFNNELGLPLTLLGLNPSHGVAVIEMGMSGRGEIEFLAKLAEPSIGVITNIGTAHMEALGSQENIALAKGELLQELPPEGIAILNADDPWCRRLGQDLKCSALYYSTGETSADVTAEDIRPWGEQGTRFDVCFLKQRQGEVTLPVPGRHNVANALAAIAVGLSLGMEFADCARGLENIQITAMRLEISDGPWQSKIINDTYNANPVSTQASLEVLTERGGNAPKIAVLGSMFELGEEEQPGHRQVGARAAAIPGLAYLVTVGELAQFIAQGAKEAGLAADKVYSFADTEAATAWLKGHPVPGAWILVKGSRGMKMEKVVQGLVKG